MLTRDLLRSLRNDLPMEFTIRQMGPQGPYSKTTEDRLRFICPHCGELSAAINPRNNLAHCFACAKNINNIDLLLLSGYDFRRAVALLERWLRLYRQEVRAAKSTSQPTATLISGPVPIRSLLPVPPSRGTVL
jgi:hypothetical protein